MDKAYMKQYMSDRRIARRKTLLEMAGNKCQKCDATDFLEFNHLDRFSKSFNLSGCHLDKAWSTILEEFDKCNLLCRDHHAEYTKLQYDSQEIVTWNKDLHGEYVHGSARTYHRGCRCSRCKTAKKLYRDKKCNNSDVVA